MPLIAGFGVLIHTKSRRTKFKNGTTREYKDGKVTSRTIYHENGQPASTKYKDENGRYYKKVEYDKLGNKIDEKVYE